MKIVSNTNILEQSMYYSMVDVMTNNNLNMFESNASTNGLYECISKAASIYKNNDGSRINFILDANDLSKHGLYDIDEVEESIEALHTVATSGNIADLVQTENTHIVFDCGSATTVID